MNREPGLRRRLVPGGAILSFHSITTPSLPAAGAAHVPLDTFKSLVRCLRRLGELVPLGDFVRRREQGRDTSGLIAITLDDAYAALASEFREFVSRENVPITIFAITDAARDGTTFWWDRIDDLAPHVARDRWRAFETVCGLPESYRRGQPRAFGPLRPLRQWLLAAHAGRWPAHLEPALCQLEEETGCRTVHRAMTFDELATLTALASVEVGVHTMSHPVLPLLEDSELEREIGHSYDVLRERSAAVVPVLAIPFGLYDARVLRVAHRAGMRTSLTLCGDTQDQAPAPYALSRYCVTTTDTCARLVLRLTGLPRFIRTWSAPPASYPELPSPTS